MLKGTNLQHAKDFNFRIVLETIRLFGPLSRADVARRTGLTAQTISNITRKALNSGLVVEADQMREGRGAPAMALRLNPDGAFAVGLDLDKDHLTAVLVDLHGNVRQRLHYELNFPPPDQALDLMESTARELMQLQGLSQDQVWGVGIGFPGPLFISRERVVTNVVNPSAFPGWHNVPVVEILSRRLALPIFLENNGTAAAIGERWYGAGQHINTFFYVFFSSGLGGGLIVNGQPYEGFTGNAGEIGYVPVLANGESDSLGKPHIGQYFNLPRLYRQLSGEGRNVATPHDLTMLYAEQNALLVSWLDTAAVHLTPIILAIEYIVDPEAIFFGGRLPDELTRDLMQRIEQRMPELRTDGKAVTPKLILATAGADAAALGVATLPLYASFAPVPRVLMKRSARDLSRTIPLAL